MERDEGDRVLPGVRPETLVDSPWRDHLRRQGDSRRRICADHRHDHARGGRSGRRGAQLPPGNVPPAPACRRRRVRHARDHRVRAVVLPVRALGRAHHHPAHDHEPCPILEGPQPGTARRAEGRRRDRRRRRSQVHRSELAHRVREPACRGPAHHGRGAQRSRPYDPRHAGRRPPCPREDRRPEPSGGQSHRSGQGHHRCRAHQRAERRSRAADGGRASRHRARLAVRSDVQWPGPGLLPARPRQLRPPGGRGRKPPDRRLFWSVRPRVRPRDDLVHPGRRPDRCPSRQAECRRASLPARRDQPVRRRCEPLPDAAPRRRACRHRRLRTGPLAARAAPITRTSPSSCRSRTSSSSSS